MFFEIVDGFLASGRVFPQLVNELLRCFVDVLQPPNPCVYLDVCLVHDDPVKTWCTNVLHTPATPHLCC